MDRRLIPLLAFFAVLLALSFLGPADRLTWALEVAPIVIATPLLLATARRFPLTSLLLVLFAIHATILAFGGAYTYAQVPLGNWLRDLLGLDRNPYDRLGHFAQGFVPALLAREVLLRTSPLQAGRWLFTLATALALSFSVFYEFIEWWTALLSGQAAEAFLGTQGDPWDTQWDMFCALLGAICAQLLLAGLQDRQIARMGVLPGSTEP